MLSCASAPDSKMANNYEYLFFSKAAIDQATIFKLVMLADSVGIEYIIRQ